MTHCKFDYIAWKSSLISTNFNVPIYPTYCLNKLCYRLWNTVNKSQQLQLLGCIIESNAHIVIDFVNILGLSFLVLIPMWLFVADKWSPTKSYVVSTFIKYVTNGVLCTHDSSTMANMQILSDYILQIQFGVQMHCFRK